MSYFVEKLCGQRVIVGIFHLCSTLEIIFVRAGLGYSLSAKYTTY